MGNTLVEVMRGKWKPHVMETPRRIPQDGSGPALQPNLAPPMTPPPTDATTQPAATEPPPAFFVDSELISLALDTAQIGVWSFNLPNQQLNSSSNVAAIHGLDEGTPRKTIGDLEQVIDPEDRDAVVTAIQELL